MKKELGSLGTESRNLRTIDMDLLNTSDLVRVIVKEEERVVPAILKANSEMTKAVNL